MKSAFVARQGLLQRLKTFCAIYRALNRKGELQRLVTWAKNKRLSGPREFYEDLLLDVRMRLMTYALESPHLVRWSRLLYRLSGLVRTTPHYPAKGSASGYRTYRDVKLRRRSR